jgi:hypothetical protein
MSVAAVGGTAAVLLSGAEEKRASGGQVDGSAQSSIEMNVAERRSARPSVERWL